MKKAILIAISCAALAAGNIEVGINTGAYSTSSDSIKDVHTGFVNELKTNNDSHENELSIKIGYRIENFRASIHGDIAKNSNDVFNKYGVNIDYIYDINKDMKVFVGGDYTIGKASAGRYKTGEQIVNGKTEDIITNVGDYNFKDYTVRTGILFDGGKSEDGVFIEYEIGIDYSERHGDSIHNSNIDLTNNDLNKVGIHFGINLLL